MPRFISLMAGVLAWAGDVTDPARLPLPPGEPVSGTVTCAGEPLAEGRIEFFHAVEVNLRVYERLDGHGRFTVELPAGTYHVAVRRSEREVPEVPEVPENYWTPSRSGLTMSVKEGGENVFSIQLAP